MIWQANFQFRSASLCPCFHVTYPHFLHAQIPDMQNFVPRIPRSGAPTTHRIILRKLISSLTMSELWMLRGPAPEQAIGVTIALKTFNLFLMDTFRFKKINLLAKKRFESQTVNGNQYPELFFFYRLQTTYKGLS